jgi:phosphoserine phosphatase
VGELILTFTGRDAPGITARISRVLAQAGARLSDVEQVVVQGLLTLGFAVAVDDEQALVKELLFVARELGLSLDFRKPEPRRGEGAHRYALTVIAATLGPADLQAVAEILAAHGANIERIQRLSEGGLEAVEFALSLEGEEAKLKR